MKKEEKIEWLISLNTLLFYFDSSFPKMHCQDGGSLGKIGLGAVGFADAHLYLVKDILSDREILKVDGFK